MGWGEQIRTSTIPQEVTRRLERRHRRGLENGLGISPGPDLTRPAPQGPPATGYGWGRELKGKTTADLQI
jgi:hypothetical protein